MHSISLERRPTIRLYLPLDSPSLATIVSRTGMRTRTEREDLSRYGVTSTFLIFYRAK